MNKRAVTNLLILFELLFLLLASGIMINQARIFAEPDSIRISNFANKAVIAFDQMLATDEDGFLTLDRSGDLVISNDDNTIKVYKNEKGGEKRAFSGEFSDDPSISRSVKIENKPRVYVVRRKGKVTLESERPKDFSPQPLCIVDPKWTSKPFYVMSSDTDLQKAKKLAGSLGGVLKKNVETQTLSTSLPTASGAPSLVWLEFVKGKEVKVFASTTNLACSNKLAQLIRSHVGDIADKPQVSVNFAQNEDQQYLSQASVGIKVQVGEDLEESYLGPVIEAYRGYFRG